MMVTDLVNLLDDPQFSKCGAHVVEWTRMEDVEREREFSQSEYVDPSTVAPGDPLPVNRTINGHVSANGDGVSWIIEIMGPQGTIDRVEGQGTLEDFTSHTGDIARELMEKLCKPKAVHISAGMNDLQLEGDVCDLTVPFFLNGSGQTAGLRVDFAPATAEGGTFTISGSAGGVPWGGGGAYSIQDVEGQGAIFLDGAWTINSPVGSFSASDVIPGTVSPIEGDCGA
jgi:hypothetical protein